MLIALVNSAVDICICTFSSATISLWHRLNGTLQLTVLSVLDLRRSVALTKRSLLLKFCHCL